MLIDLQLHSTYSDGYLTPTEIAEFAAERKVKVAALTDHNTVGGLDEFRLACKKLKIKPITGIEIYAKLGHKRLNILWYNFDDRDPELHKILRETQQRRRGNIRRALQKLTDMEIKININKTTDKHNHYIPINHIIDDIWSVNKNKEIIRQLAGVENPRAEEIIRACFYNKKIGILCETYVDIGRILKLRKKIGGQIILGHPAKSSYITRELLIKLKKAGLDGVETISPHHSLGAVMFIQEMANELKFIETGGSDFHLSEGGNYLIQNFSDYFYIDSKYLKGVEKIIG